MALLKLHDFDPNYREASAEYEINGFDVYSDTTNDKVGAVGDILVDDNGHFRYLIVDLGFWIFGKKVLLPVGRSRIDYSARRVYATGMTREQAENLPEFNDNMTADYDYEERVRGVYRPTATTGTSKAVGTQSAIGDVNDYSSYDRNTYKYQQEPNLYAMNDRDHQTLKLYEERLIANKNRVKTGEVAVGKRVETETARVAVPIEKERVVIERSTPTDAGTVVSSGEATFQDGEVARIDVYEETPDIHKEAFVREEVRVRKEVDHDTVDTEETIRRERLDVNTQGKPTINNPQI